MKIRVFCCFLSLLYPQFAYSQASLAAEDSIANITVPSAPEETFTLVKDARSSSQWYYFPNRPRLSEIRANGVSKPEFTLLKYQYRNPSNPEEPLEGAILQFSASLDLPPVVLADLKKSLIASLEKQGDKLGKEVRLAALPLKSATVQLYTPGGESLVANSFGTGNAPVIGSQKMVFSLDLTKTGANVYTGLTAAGQTGIPVVLTLTYSGVTPPTGFKVTVNWDQTYKHFSTHKDFRARASYFGLFGGSAAVDRRKVSDELTKNNCIKVEITSGGESADDLLDKHLEGVLARINRELEVALTPPPTIEPAQASKPNTAGYFGGAGYSVAMKSVTSRKTGEETIDFTQKQVVDRVTTCGGFIGIGSYPENVRNELITVAPPDAFASAYLLLPTVLQDQVLSIASASLEFQLMDKANKTVDSRAFQWDATVRNWLPHPKKPDAQPATLAYFPLLSYKDTLGDMKIRSVLKLDQAGFNTETIEDIAPVSNGQRAFYSLPDAGNLVSFDGSALDWSRFGGNVEKVELRLECSDGALRTGTLTPTFKGGSWAPPDPFPFLIPKKGNSSITPMVSITLKGEGEKFWQNNKLDLLTNTRFNPRRIVLMESDFKAAP